MCNPSTGQLAALPIGHKTTSRDAVTQGRYASVGLGYDVHTKKHKAVRICYQGIGCGVSSAVCEVYVVNSTRRWKPIHEKPPAWVRFYKPSVFAQGHVHWLAWKDYVFSDNANAKMVIVSFSLSDHTFGTVAPPLGIESQSLSTYELTLLDGHLCLFSYAVSQTSSYDVWLLSEHGVPVWNLRCRIDMTKVSPDITQRFVACHLHPLAIINNGGRILFVRPNRILAGKYSRVCAYDLVTGEIDDIYSGSNMVYHYYTNVMDAAMYEESIISFG
jgi:F-box interacting protein